jgi:hypothetical protein
MTPAPVGSFVRFLVGFLTFISVSLGLTIAVNTYASAKDTQQAAAAAKALMLQKH